MHQFILVKIIFFMRMTTPALRGVGFKKSGGG
jgi:hypothetical protein